MTQNGKKVVAKLWLFCGREKYFHRDIFVRLPFNSGAFSVDRMQSHGTSVAAPGKRPQWFS